MNNATQTNHHFAEAARDAVYQAIFFPAVTSAASSCRMPFRTKYWRAS